MHELHLSYEITLSNSSSSKAHAIFYTIDDIHSKIMGAEGGGIGQAQVTKILKEYAHESHG